MRELANWQVSGARGTKAVFEGLVGRQELGGGGAGPLQRAMSMTPSGIHRIVTILASRVYRGPRQKRYIIITGLGGGDCGFNFETGKQYLVFIDTISGENFYTSICTPTELLEHSGPVLRVLRGEPAAPEDMLGIVAYYRRMRPQWFGKICGRVSKADGTPLAGAQMELQQMRDDPFPPQEASDPDLSKPDGTYPIPNIEPGRYLLTAHTTDFKAWTRFMGYYPGVTKHSEAVPLEIKAGDAKSGLNFRVQKQPLFSVQVLVVNADGTPHPSNDFQVSLDSPERDALAYHLHRNGPEEDGIYWFGYVPAGRYRVTTSFTEQDVEVTGNTKLVLKLERKR